MRIYDPRVGKFLSVDPLTPKYPELTPYQFASNRPIDGIDLDGEEWKTKHKWGDMITDKRLIDKLGDDYTKGMTYKQAWTIMAPKILESQEGNPFDCANLSIYTLVSFAYENRLPVYFQDYKRDDTDPTIGNSPNKNGQYGYYTIGSDNKKTFNALKEGDWYGLYDALANHNRYGAADLFNNRNLTEPKDFLKLEPGDLVGIKYTAGDLLGHYHSQTVYETGEDWAWLGGGDGKPDYYISIQGNLSNGKPVPAEETRRYYLKDPQYTAKKQSIHRGFTWDFKNFDNHSGIKKTSPTGGKTPTQKKK